MGIGSPRERRLQRAADRFHEERAEHGFEGRSGRERREAAEKQLISDILDEFPYSEWLKRREEGKS